MAAPIVVVMGVAGCGKSTVAGLLARTLGLAYVEGDDLHSPENVARMRSGIALTDEQRRDWLELLSARIAEARAASRGLVVTCSALRRSYRDVLRRGAPDLHLVHLTGTRELLGQRIAARAGHYMPPSLLDSQIATLEPPADDENALVFDVADPTEAIAARIVGVLRPVYLVSAESIAMTTFTKTILFTDADGRARFRDEAVALDEGTPQSRLSRLFPSGGYQLRHSPVGFRSQFHCTGTPQWVFILGGRMEIGLQDGTSRTFGPGEHFFSADTLPDGAVFDPATHGHWSRQVGDEPLVTLFVRG